MSSRAPRLLWLSSLSLAVSLALSACSGGADSGGAPPLTPLSGTWNLQGTPVGSTPCAPPGLVAFSTELSSQTSGNPDVDFYAAFAAGLEGPPHPLANFPLAVSHLQDVEFLGTFVAMSGLYYHPGEDATVQLSWPQNANLQSTVAADLNAFDTVVEFEVYQGYRMVPSTDELGNTSWSVPEDAVPDCSGLLRLDAQRGAQASAAEVDQRGEWRVGDGELPVYLDHGSDGRALVVAIPTEAMPELGTLVLSVRVGERGMRARVERGGRRFDVELSRLRESEAGLDGTLRVVDLEAARGLIGPLRTRRR